ncbi:MAG: 2-C-methyl-D-erythritol 2,4-cyclodiphosphate synthase [bacterium]|nr:2-C-methyl-D-erythritol 2,4-cyclodiphosphate synthase [bacterium]
MFIGVGIDAHRFSRERKLILGGVEIPFEMGLEGHSDADVLTHSVADAILGALGEGDIGKHFPDSDDRFKDICSLMLLKEIRSRWNFKIHNIDSVIVCQKPKLALYKEQMETNIADALKLNKRIVCVKATTTEYMGFTGRGEGICVVANVLLERE